MDINEYINSESDLIALLELQQLYRGDVFVVVFCNGSSNNKKHPELMSVHFLPHKSQLWLRQISSAGTANNMNIHEGTNISGECASNGGLKILDISTIKVSRCVGLNTIYICIQFNIRLAFYLL